MHMVGIFWGIHYAVNIRSKTTAYGAFSTSCVITKHISVKICQGSFVVTPGIFEEIFHGNTELVD